MAGDKKEGEDKTKVMNKIEDKGKNEDENKCKKAMRHDVEIYGERKTKDKSNNKVRDKNKGKRHKTKTITNRKKQREK
jgi:hypothetical protein